MAQRNRRVREIYCLPNSTALGDRTSRPHPRRDLTLLRMR